MKLRGIKLAAAIAVVSVTIPFHAQAQNALAGLDTTGAVFEIAPKTGVVTPVVEEAINGFVLGATTRHLGKFYYVAQPSGTTQNALYTAVLKTGALSHVNLDRNDSVRALFFRKKQLYGIFYDGNLGTAGLYKIAKLTGVTTLVLDLSTLDLEPIAGAFADFRDSYYMLAKPESDSTQRRLVRFKASAKAPVVMNVVDSLGAAVLCNHFKPNAKRQSFVCLASAAGETQVDFHRLALNGVATYVSTLPGILRVGSGHTLATLDQNRYYAFVYVPGEPDNQHFLKLSSKGAILSNVTLDRISIGAHFQSESPPSNN